MLNEVLILLVLFVTGQERRVLRVFAASAFGAVISILLLVCKVKFGILYVSISFVSTFYMMFLVCGKKGLREIMIQALYFFILSSLFQELLQTIHSVWDIDNMLPALFGALVLLLWMTWFLRKSQKEKQENVLYRVEITEQGKSIEVTALLDTGNCLKEPFSKKPVSIVNKEQLQELWELRRPEKSKVIPFYSVGKTHGILQGMEVERIVIFKGEESITIQRPIVAVYEGILSQTKRYQMILHRELLE